MTSGSINDPTNATYGMSITAGAGETVELSSAEAHARALLAGNTGSTHRHHDSQRGHRQLPAHRRGRPAGQPRSSSPICRAVRRKACSAPPPTPTSGTTTAQSTVVDAQGNVYVLGNATGNFGNAAQPGHAGRLSVEIRFRRQSAMDQARRQRGHAQALPRWRSIPTAAWSIAGTTKPISPPAPSPTATMTASSRPTMPTAIRTGNSRSRR